MSKRFWCLRQRLGEWRQQQRARRQQLRQRQQERNRRLWGGPVEAGRVLAFSDAIFAIAITLLTLNLEVPADLHGAEFTRALKQVLPASCRFLGRLLAGLFINWPSSRVPG